MRWLPVVLVVVLLGCTDNNKIPANVIQRPKMEKVLWEMVEADRFATSFIQSRKDSLGRNKKETIDVYDKVFSFNGISREDFINSYKFYMSRPDLLKSMFDSISAQAERRRAEVYNHPKPNTHIKTDSLKHRADSIRNVVKNSGDSGRKKILPAPPIRIKTDSLRHRADSIRKRSRINRDSVSKKIFSTPLPPRLP